MLSEQIAYPMRTERRQQLPRSPAWRPRGEGELARAQEQCMVLWNMPQDQHKLGTLGQALPSSYRREGLFHPMENLLDKRKLIIYQRSLRLFVGSRHQVWNETGW